MTPEERQERTPEVPPDEPRPDQLAEEQRGLSMLGLVGTILAAAFGVQSHKARERDFSQRSPWPFIVGGILFGIMFVVTLVLIVSMVLPD